MKDLTRAANARYGFLLEDLSKSTSIDWTEYKLKLNELLKLSKWKIDLNRTNKSGRNIMQCLFDKAATITFESLSYNSKNFAAQCKEVCRYIQDLTLLGAKFDITSQNGQNALNSMENYMRKSAVVSYKAARAKYIRKDATAKRMLKVVHKNGFAPKHFNSIQEKSA